MRWPPWVKLRDSNAAPRPQPVGARPLTPDQLRARVADLEDALRELAPQMCEACRLPEKYGPAEPHGSVWFHRDAGGRLSPCAAGFIRGVLAAGMVQDGP